MLAGRNILAAQRVGDDQPKIEQRVETSYTLMNNSNCNSASAACSTILDLPQYVEDNKDIVLLNSS